MEPWQLRPARDLELPPSQQFRSLQRENGLVFTMFHHAWWHVVRGYLAMWHRLRIVGREHVPLRPPFILVANHTSHLDALVLSAVLSWRVRDRVFPIAAGDVFFETPLASAFAAGLLNALPMWRKRCGPHALEQLRQRLIDEPCAYILFPEGTRSRDGSMVSFKPGLGMIVAGTDVPVIPCHLTGCFEALPSDRRWPSPKAIEVRVGEPLRFADEPNTRTGWQRVATLAEARVRALAPLATTATALPAPAPASSPPPAPDA